MDLPKPSDEQLKIIDSLDNVVVDSVAGSGKTTTCLLFAQKNKDKKILLLTYNARLKIETRERSDHYGLTNLEVHSYHSFFYNYYSKVSTDDTGLKKCLEKQPKKKYSYNILILDEVQDMTPLFYEAVFKIKKDSGKFERAIIVGDVRQCIFDKEGTGINGEADTRYLTFAKNIFKKLSSAKVWNYQKLHVTFRLTPTVCDLINKCFVGNDLLIPFKKDEGDKPKYLICNVYNDPAYEVKQLLKEGYDLSDIYILSWSVSSNPNSPVKLMENKLLYDEDFKSKIYISGDDESKLDEDVTKNKLVFTTIHKTKGLERKVIMLLDFDHWKGRKNPQVLQNVYYVGLTRATEKLIIVHSKKNGYLSFIDRQKLPTYANVTGETSVNDKEEISLTKVSVTKLLKYLSSNMTDKCLTYFSYKQLSKEHYEIVFPGKIKEGEEHEEVYEINGHAFPFYFEYYNKGKISVSVEDDDTKKVMKEMIKDNKLIIEDFLKFCVYYSCERGFKYKKKQITKYDWIDEKTFEDCNDRMKILFSKDTNHEVGCSSGDEKFNGKIIEGRIDIIDGDTIWEIKAVKKIKNVHLIQLAIYAYLHDKKQKMKYKLLNILTGELWEIKMKREDIREMLNVLTSREFKKDDDKVFLERCKNIRKK